MTTKAALAAFAQGYQEALQDIKAQFDQNGPDAALTYINANITQERL